MAAYYLMLNIHVCVCVCVCMYGTQLFVESKDCFTYLFTHRVS